MNKKGKQVWKYDIKLNATHNGKLCQLLAAFEEVYDARLTCQELVDVCFEQGFNVLAARVKQVAAAKLKEMENGKESGPDDTRADSAETSEQQDGNSGAPSDPQEGSAILRGPKGEHRSSAGIILPGQG